MQMTDKNWVARLDISRTDLPWPILGIVAPLIGLVYIVVLPFFGLVSLIFLGVCRVRESLPAIWHRVVRTAVIV